MEGKISVRDIASDDFELPIMDENMCGDVEESQSSLHVCDS